MLASPDRSHRAATANCRSEKKKNYGGNNPDGSAIFKQASCHVERSRDISILMSEFGATWRFRRAALAASLGMTVICYLTRARELRASARHRPQRFLEATPRADKYRKLHCSGRAIQ